MLIVIAKILLAPILLIQGLYVRKTIIKLPEASGARAGQRGDGPTLKLLILGDSAAAGVGAACQDQALSGSVVKALESHFTVQWTLLAKTGETTDSMRIQLMQTDLDAFDVVLISLGVNDTTSGKSVQMYEQQTVALIQQLKNQLDAEHIIFSGLPPMGEFPALPHPLRWFLGLRSRQLDQNLQNIAAAKGCLYLPMELAPDPSLIAEDGFHPGPEVYAVWGEHAARMIMQQCKT